MIWLVLDKPEVTAEWVARQLWPGGHVDRFGPMTAVAVVQDGRPLAGVVYSNFHGFEVDMSIATVDPRWCQRGVLRALFHIPFVQMGCVRVNATTAKGNKDARRLLSGSGAKGTRKSTGLGFTEEGSRELGFDGVQTAIYYGLRRDKCRWIGEFHGQEFGQRTGRA